MDFALAALTAGLDGICLTVDDDGYATFVVDLYVSQNGTYTLMQEDARVTLQHLAVQITDYFGDFVAFTLPIHLDFHFLPSCNTILFTSQANEHVALDFQSKIAAEAFLRNVAIQNAAH